MLHSGDGTYCFYCFATKRDKAWCFGVVVVSILCACSSEDKFGLSRVCMLHSCDGNCCFATKTDKAWCFALMSSSRPCVFAAATARSLSNVYMLPQRVCCPQQSAVPVQHLRGPEQAQGRTSPTKNRCDKQVSSWRHISCHTDKNRYYT